MNGAGKQGIKIGEILVRHKVLTKEQVETILAEQRRSARPFGDLAERFFGISPRAIEEAWVSQYLDLVGVVDLEEMPVDFDCIRLINRRQAWQFKLLPMNRQGGELAIATDEQNIVRALNFATRGIDEAVYLMIAEPEQLREHLMLHYPVPREIADFADRIMRTAV